MANWKWKIKGVKDLFEKESNAENIIALCDLITSQLSRVKPLEKDFDEDDIDWIEMEKEEISDNFSFLKNLLDGTIPEKDWSNFGFSFIEREEWFNGYLDSLYNFGDTSMRQKDGYRVKLLWIG